MSEDLGKTIKQITDMLSQDTLPDNLKGLLNLLAGSGSKDKTSQSKLDIQSGKEEKTERSESDDSMDILRKAGNVMSRLGSVNDPRVNLLYAIKPFLNTSRQKKLNTCVRLLQLSSVARLMEDNHDKDSI